jgi:Bacterial archaeo-eukaryotic release factor family 3
MAEFSREELKALVDEEVPPCVSIYMPTYQQEGQLRQDETRFRNLLREAEDRLAEKGVERESVDKILGPARQLLDDKNFWAYRKEGLALFMANIPDSLHLYSDKSRAIQFNEIVSVAEHFYVKPLLPLLTGDGQFYLLTLSQRHIGLFAGTRDKIWPVELRGVPHNIDEALGYEIPEPVIQGRPMNVDGGEQTGIFGGYDPSNETKDRIKRYLRAVNDGIHKMLAKRTEPLVLAGQDHYVGMYRDLNTYPHLVEHGIPRNPETLRAEDLHEQAWALVEPGFRKERQDAIDRYHHLIATSGQASNKLEEVVPAAFYARVATLFVARDKQRFGTFDPNSGNLEVHDEARPNDIDLIDEAATQTILYGGVVYALAPEEMPDPKAMVAAIFRY